MKQAINVEELRVNPENYRFDPVDTEDQAIDLMIEKKGPEILALAKHILDYGLDRARDVRVIRHKEVFLVLDGNRRVTAVKCLLNPNLIKNKKLKVEFERLPQLFSKTPPTEISCYVYDNEKEASEWIRLDHTGKNSGAGLDNWGAPEKDRFDYKFGGKLSPAMQILDLLQSKGYTFDNSKLKISTINRILSYPSIRTFLGIDIKQNNVQIVSKEEDTITRLNALFTQIIDKNIKVAAVYDKDKALAFMKDLFGKPLAKNDEQTSMGIEEPEEDQLHDFQSSHEIAQIIPDKEENERKNEQAIQSNEHQPSMFVITAFAGLDNVYNTIYTVAKSLFKNMEVKRIDYSSGARDTQDQKIIKALETSDFLIVVLSMGVKERMAYEAIKQSPNASLILEKYFPINHNVLLEFGYGLKCVKGTRREKDIFIIVEDIDDNGLPNLKDFCRMNFFDIRNRDQIAYKSIPELEEGLERAFKHSETMKQYIK